ncbi:subtilisin family serine protease [Actinoplanes lutulentus]|uniref:Subtilisin family serine protease n=1 Tax=Actinoplanes lutulentus TaxID=1287878 RepID=A0A327ZAL9_9ACTN|nr:S8 family peptidase [Actinoplanes lutulentus]MBB2947444.1 subtilisin family serine protease [Actinoplanes lutulentus]RAK36717.1 subtilisin family serine protease [Actinoplanes lutulentus]
MRPTATRAAAVLVGTALAVAVTPSAAEATGTVLNADSPTAIAGTYLITLKDGNQIDRSRADRLAQRYGGDVGRVFGHAIEGYTATLTARQAARLAADPSVATVEADQTVRVTDTQTSAPWGLDRIDQRALPLSGTYTYGPSSGVTVYVVDTGITIGHQDFGGRASYGYDAVDNDAVAQDGNGHGTFVAGVAAGSTYGVAKSASVVGVRVLNNSGSGTTAGVIAGIDWVTANAVPGRSVANLSLGGGASTTLDAAVRRSITAGIPYAIAAGNSGVNAANTSPARVTQALTVGATDRNDAKASWSNYGSVLDLFAPGVSITSAWRTSNTATYTGSGTSFSSPHVAGAAALYLAANPGASVTTVNAAIVNNATTGVVTSPGSGSPNRLLYVG